MDNRQLGNLGEDMAAGYLEKQGCRVLRRNYRCREGEIDIIAEKGGVLSLVEVKTRRSDSFGRPAEAVDLRKREHIKKAAMNFLSECEEYYPYIRMDVIEIVINHIRGAF